MTNISDYNPSTTSISVNVKYEEIGGIKYRITGTGTQNILEPVVIRIDILDKDYHAPESAILVTSITIDDIELVPSYIQYFDYDNDHDYKDPTTYLGFNGSWILDTKIPFYRWYHTASGYGWMFE